MLIIKQNWRSCSASAKCPQSQIYQDIAIGRRSLQSTQSILEPLISLSIRQNVCNSFEGSVELAPPDSTNQASSSRPGYIVESQDILHGDDTFRKLYIWRCCGIGCVEVSKVVQCLLSVTNGMAYLWPESEVEEKSQSVNRFNTAGPFESRKTDLGIFIKD